MMTKQRLIKRAQRIGENRRKRKLHARRVKMQGRVDMSRFRRALVEWSKNQPKHKHAKPGVVDRVKGFFKRKPSV